MLLRKGREHPDPDTMVVYLLWGRTLRQGSVAALRGPPGTVAQVGEWAAGGES